MVDKIVQLVDANDDNIFPLSSDPNAAHITMTTTDPGEGSPLGQNEFVAVYGGDPIIMDYSTAEINTGAKWIDGKTIYKKTIATGTLPDASAKTVPYDITNLSQIIKIEGYAFRSLDNATLPLPFVSGTSSYEIAISVDNSGIVIGTAIDRSNMTGYITLYYTKTS